MEDAFHIKRIILPILLLACQWFVPLQGMEGVGVYLKASLSGKIYRGLSFLVEEDIRPRDDFKEAEWFLTTAEINYRINRHLLAGGGYMSLVRYKASEDLRHRYYLYVTGNHTIGPLTLSVRERFQATYKAHTGNPKNYLRSMLNVSCRIGKSGLSPFAYAEVFNDTSNRMRSDKIRLSAGSNYRLDAHNSLQLYYRYHIFHVNDPVNYRHAIGICYMHRF